MNELVTAKNYYRIRVGTKLSYPGNPNKYALVTGMAPKNHTYEGQWRAQ